jgi:hypothetical protein
MPTAIHFIYKMDGLIVKKKNCYLLTFLFTINKLFDTLILWRKGTWWLYHTPTRSTENERKVLPKDIECALLNGKRTKKRDRQNALLKTWSYAFEGSTIDERELRVIVAIDDLLKIVTVVILSEEGEDL